MTKTNKTDKTDAERRIEIAHEINGHLANARDYGGRCENAERDVRAAEAVLREHRQRYTLLVEVLDRGDRDAVTVKTVVEINECIVAIEAAEAQVHRAKSWLGNSKSMEEKTLASLADAKQRLLRLLPDYEIQETSTIEDRAHQNI